MSRKGRVCMKKEYIAALATGVGLGAWCIHRDQKYPVRRELRFANKLAVPGWTLNLKTAEMANRALDRMALTLPAPPKRVESWGTAPMRTARRCWPKPCPSVGHRTWSSWKRN